MSDRIDHAAEAREILDDINNAGLDDNLPMDWAGATADEQWLVNASHAQAQVHATLALVEQQRIANLIALARCGVGELTAEALAGLAHQVTHPDYPPITVPALRPEIRKGLGL